MAADIIIGIPSKGRLQENVEKLFAKAGLTIHRSQGQRGYRAHFNEIKGIQIALLSASEIVHNLKKGDIHFGITGLDLLYENISDFDDYIHKLAKLDFGYADVIVAVPAFWIDVNNMNDFDEVAFHYHKKHNKKMRVATKYFSLTRNFFKEHDIVDYRIVSSAGATEGAPASGSAEIIVDITSTGQTLKANHLKILNDGVILKSQAALVAAKMANWSGIDKAKLEALLDRLQAESGANIQIDASYFS